MAKFLFAKVVVRTIEVDAADLKTAKEFLGLQDEHIQQSKTKSEYVLEWEETPESDTVVVRDHILGQFLDLMQHQIPPVAEKKLIELPFKNPPDAHVL